MTERSLFRDLVRAIAEWLGYMPSEELDALQPMPIGLQIAPAGSASHPKTAIARSWREGDPARCRLCPTCTVNPTNFCLIVTPGVVAPKDGALFRLTPDMLAATHARRSAPHRPAFARTHQSGQGS